MKRSQENLSRLNFLPAMVGCLSVVIPMVMFHISEAFGQTNPVSLVADGGLALPPNDIFESRKTFCGRIGGVWKPGEMVNGRFYPIDTLIAASNAALKRAIARGSKVQVNQLSLNINELLMRLVPEQQECERGPEIGALTRMSISSSVVAHGQTLPSIHTCYGNDGVRREGSGIFPPLKFENVPPKATSLLVLLTEAGSDEPVLWNLLNSSNTAPSWREVSQQMKDTRGMVVNVNTLGARRYAGPCPAEGAVGSYTFELYALSGAMTPSFGLKARDIRSTIKPFVVAEANLEVNALGGPTAQKEDSAPAAVAPSCPPITPPSGSGGVTENFHTLPSDEGWLALDMDAREIPDRVEIYDANNPSRLLFASRSMSSLPRRSICWVFNPCNYREGDFSGIIRASFVKPLGVTKLRVVVSTSPEYARHTGWQYSLSCSLLSKPPSSTTPMSTPRAIFTATATVAARPTSTPTRAPTMTPTMLPTARPTSTPTRTPTVQPTLTSSPTPMFSPSPTPRRVARNFDVSPKGNLVANNKLTIDFAGLQGNRNTNLLVELVDVAGTPHKCKGGLQFKMPPSGSITYVATLPNEIGYFRHVTLYATMPNWGASQQSTIATRATAAPTVGQVRAVCNAILKSVVLSSSTRTTPGAQR